MATLEDKILGEKLHNYCSSSESEPEDDGSGSESNSGGKSNTESLATLPQPNKWEGTSSNTGPKGVISDWQRFKQLENEKRVEQEKERIALMKKLTLTCKSALEEEREKAASEDPELAELLSDDFLLAYQKQRMQEMITQSSNLPVFGKVFNLKSGQEFLEAIDKEESSVTVIVHIYEEDVETCHVMNSCLEELCVEHPNVKFCTIVGSKAGMSNKFKAIGVPALLVYKKGQLVGNFVRVSNELGNDFSPSDVECFLTEHGMLLDKSFMPRIITQNNEHDSDTD